MIYTREMINAQYQEYKNKSTKLARDIRDGKVHRVINGLYVDEPNVPGYLLACSVYGPSYISFEYALSVYGLIPERVTTVTCASSGKKKKKRHITDFGVFTYRDVPKDAYQECIRIREENGYSYQIATPEKALCDKLYTVSPLKNYTNLEEFLFEDLRIDEEEFNKLRIDEITKISGLYHSTNVELLSKYLRSTKYEQNNRANA